MTKKKQLSPSLRSTLKEVETVIIESALTKTYGNITKAAELLKIPRPTLMHKMKRLKIKSTAFQVNLQ